MTAASLRDRLAPIAYRVGILSLFTSLTFGLIHRWDERTPCPTYVWSTVAAIVIGVGFVANVITLRKRGILMALILVAVTSITTPSATVNRQSKNESKTLATMKAIRTAEDALFASSGRRGTIPDLVASGFIPRCVADASWGYWFEARMREEGLTITASPAAAGSGRWTFYMGPDGITRYSPEKDFAPAGQANAPVR